MDEGFFSAAEARRSKPTPSLLPRCDVCKFYQGCQSPKMKPTGEGRRGILICGDYPGKTEDETGLQYSGGTGDWLESELKRVGINMRKDCWLTNATICYNANPGDHKTCITDCRPNLLKTIKDLDPEIIVLMGGAAVKSLIGHIWKDDYGGITKWVGWRVPAHKPNAWICPMNNPAFLTRSKDPVLDRQFHKHLKAVAELDGRPWPKGPPNYGAQVECITNPSEAARRLKAYTSGIVAFDYETNCIKPDADTSEIICASVCWNGKETISFPWHGAVKPAMMDLLEDPDVGKIGFNLDFESRWTRAKLGVEVRNWVWDGMLAGHCLDQRGVSSLKFQALVRLGVGDYNSHIEPFLDSTAPGDYSLNRIREVGLPMILKYCGMDSILEYDVAHHQAREMGATIG